MKIRSGAGGVPKGPVSTDGCPIWEAHHGKECDGPLGSSTGLKVEFLETITS